MGMDAQLSSILADMESWAVSDPPVQKKEARHPDDYRVRPSFSGNSLEFLPPSTPNGRIPTRGSLRGMDNGQRASMRSQASATQKELHSLRFPMFVHCFFAMFTQSGGAVEGGALAQPHLAFLKAHAQEHATGSNPDKRKQVEELLNLAVKKIKQEDSTIARLYLTQRVSWVCSEESFAAVTRFLVDEKLHLLLRIFVLYFNVHAVRRVDSRQT